MKGVENLLDLFMFNRTLDVCESFRFLVTPCLSIVEINLSMEVSVCPTEIPLQSTRHVGLT